LPSKDILDKLFGVEAKAESLVADAQAEAARRVNAAREAADIDFKAVYEATASRIDAGRRGAEAAADAEHEGMIRDYEARLKAAKLDREAFNRVCERYMSGIA